VYKRQVIAQGIKVIVSASSEKRINLRRFIEPGGMPSSHAAVVVALLTGVGAKEGMESTIFIVTLVLALVTIYEAIGVRRETGRQAELLNELQSHLSPRSPMKYKLTEQLGHNPIEVLMGGILGFFIALLFL